VTRGFRRALAAGLLAVLAYLAGAALSGAASPWARRPLLDGLAPPTPYRWVKPPPELAQGNRPPTRGGFQVRLAQGGSQVSAFGTGDGQFNLVLAQGAIAARPGQSLVVLDIAPLDPAKLGKVPAGLLAAGNAYRLTAAYRPSGRPVGRLAGETNVGMVYPLLSVPVLGPAAHVVLWSRNGRSWTRLSSVDAPGAHQASARITAPGYFLVAVPPGPVGQDTGAGGGSALPLVLLVAVVAVATVAGVVLLVRFWRRA
jgi:hypothetical protein